jgi:hypothetical protein
MKRSMKANNMMIEFMRTTNILIKSKTNKMIKAMKTTKIMESMGTNLPLMKRKTKINPSIEMSENHC